MKDVRKAHHECTANRRAENGSPGGIDAGAGRHERLNPEIERILESIDSGTYVSERHEIDEYVKYVKNVLE